MVLRRMDARQLAAVVVFFANLPLVLASASLEMGKGVRSISNHNQSRPKSCRSTRLSRAKRSAQPCRNWATCGAAKAFNVRASVDCSANCSRPQARANATSGRSRVLVCTTARQPAKILTRTSSSFAAGVWSTVLRGKSKSCHSGAKTHCALDSSPGHPGVRSSSHGTSEPDESQLAWHFSLEGCAYSTSVVKVLGGIWSPANFAQK